MPPSLGLAGTETTPTLLELMGLEATPSLGMTDLEATLSLLRLAGLETSNPVPNPELRSVFA